MDIKSRNLRQLNIRTLLLAVSCMASYPMQIVAQTEIMRRDVINIGLGDVMPERIIVYVDDMDVTAFATVEENVILFKNPFPDRRSSFNLTVIDDSSGEMVFEQRYRHARPGELFDRVEFSGAGQLDSSYINRDEQTPEFEDEIFSESDAGMGSQDNLVGGINLEMQRGRVGADLSFEAVNTTDPDAVLRANGPSADISRFRLNSSLKLNSGSRFNISAGDVELYSENDLVNSGVASRGLSIGYVTADERLALEVGRLFGSDIVGAVKGPIAWSEDSYRVGARIDATLVRRSSINWSLHGSILNLQRSAEDNFGISETPDAEKNKVRGVGTRFGLFDERLRLKLDWADSTYDNPLELSQFDDEIADEFEGEVDGEIEGELEIFSPGETTGKAWRHSLGWSAWSGQLLDKSASLDITLGAEQASPLYRSVHGIATADRRQRSAILDSAWSFVSMQYSDTRFRNNLDNLVSIHTLDESVQNLSINFNLEASYDEYFPEQEYESDEQGMEDTAPEYEGEFVLPQESDGTPWLQKLKPTQISISSQRQDVKTLNGDVIILAPVIEGLDFVNQTTDSYNLSLSWASTKHFTTLDLGYSFLDIDQQERAQADRRDTSYGLQHEFNGDRWRLGGRVGFNYTNDLDPSTRSKFSLAEWGVSASYQSAFGVTIAGTADYSNNDFTDFVSNGTSRANSERYSVSLDFGNMVKRMLSLRTFPSLSAAWQKSESKNKSEFETFDSASSSMLINLGLSF